MLTVTATLELLARSGPATLPARLARLHFVRETATFAASAVHRLGTEPDLYGRVVAVQFLVRALGGLTLSQRELRIDDRSGP